MVYWDGNEWVMEDLGEVDDRSLAGVGLPLDLAHAWRAFCFLGFYKRKAARGRLWGGGG